MDKRKKIQFKNAAINVATATFMPVCAAVFTALAPITGTVYIVKYIKEKKENDVHVSNKEDVVRALQIYGAALVQPTLGAIGMMKEVIENGEKELVKYDDNVNYVAKELERKNKEEAQKQQQQAAEKARKEKIVQANTPDALAKSGVQDLLNIIRTAPSMGMEYIPDVQVQNKVIKHPFDNYGRKDNRYYFATIGDGIKFTPNAVWVDGKKVLDIPELQQQTVYQCYFQRYNELLDQQKDQEVQDAIKLMRLRANVSEK